MSRRFLESEHLDEIFADAEVAAMALEMGLGEVVVEKRVVLQPGAVEFQRIEIEGALQNGEGFFFPENACSNKIAYVRAKAFDFLAKGRFGLRDFAFVQADGFGRRETRAEFRRRTLGIFRKSEDCTGE